MRHARERQQKVAAPAVINAHLFQLREGFQHFGQDQRIDIGGIASAVYHAAAIQQPVVGGQTKVVQQVIAVFDAEIIGQQRQRHIFG
ncbi:hypothetical protein D3C76_1495490 [compost metagenome]